MTFELGQENIDKMTKYGIPGYMQEGLTEYFENRRPPGGFLTAILENDLMGAVARADDTNINCLRSYGTWLYECAPMRSSGIWGSKEAVENWLNGKEIDI